MSGTVSKNFMKNLQENFNDFKQHRKQFIVIFHRKWRNKFFMGVCSIPSIYGSYKLWCHCVIVPMTDQSVRHLAVKDLCFPYLPFFFSSSSCFVFTRPVDDHPLLTLFIVLRAEKLVAAHLHLFHLLPPCVFLFVFSSLFPCFLFSFLLSAYCFSYNLGKRFFLFL